eukprot:3151625-Lingulodinium_polyedra.AAC.1
MLLSPLAPGAAGRTRKRPGAQPVRGLPPAQAWRGGLRAPAAAAPGRRARVETPQWQQAFSAQRT